MDWDNQPQLHSSWSSNRPLAVPALIDSQTVDKPEPWKVGTCERFQNTHFTAIRWGASLPAKQDLGSLAPCHRHKLMRWRTKMRTHERSWPGQVQSFLQIALIVLFFDTAIQAQPSAPITEYSVPTANSGLVDITRGPDNAMWFTENAAHKVGRIDVNGTITEFAIPSGGSPYGIAATDTDLWVTLSPGNSIARITTSGVVTEYPIPTPNSNPTGIVRAAFETIWFLETDAKKIARFTPTTAVFTEYPIPGGLSPRHIESNGSTLLFTADSSDAIGVLAADDISNTTFSFQSDHPQTASTGLGSLTGNIGSPSTWWFIGFNRMEA